MRKNNCATGASLLCDAGSGPDSSWFDFLAEPDTTYYFIVDGAFNSDFGPHTFTLQDVTLPNDICPGTVIPALPYTDNGNTQNASHQYTGSCYSQSAPDVVYSFTPSDSVLVRATVLAPWSNALQVRQNNCATGASLLCDIGSGADSSWIVFLAKPDSTYYFIVDGTFNSDYGPYSFTLEELAPLPNDFCPGTVIPVLPYTDSGDTQLASHQYSGSCYSQSAPDLVYQYTSPSWVFVRASMVATWFDCMHVRKNNCATGASLQCDFGNGADSSWFEFLAEPDSTYYFIVDGAYNTDFGPFSFNLQEVMPPVVNDFCPGTAIPALPYADNGTTAAATRQYSGCGSYASDVVYRYSSPASVLLRVTLNASWNDVLQVRKNNCASGASLLCDVGWGADSSWFNFWVERDSTYYFILSGANGFDIGPYIFTLQDVTLPNDICPGTLIPALPYTDSGSTAGATHQYNGSCYTEYAPDVVYTFTSADSVLVRASIVANWLDCMQVRKNNCATGASLLCDNGFRPGGSMLEFWAEPDSTYYFIVDGYYHTEFGPYTFTLQDVTLPNDFCPGTVVPALPFTVAGSTTTASHQYSGSCYTNSAQDVVYSFVSPDSTLVRATLLAAWSEALHVRKNNCATGASLLCDIGLGADTAWFNFWAEPDSTYYFIVDGVAAYDQGPFAFSLQELTPLPNDTCPGTLIPALPYTESGSTVAASHQYNGSCYPPGFAPDVVFQYTPPDSIYLLALMEADWFDGMQVRKNNCATGASLRCDLGIYTDGSWFAFWAEPDSTYYFILDGAYDRERGSYTFTLQESNDFCPGTMIPALPYTDSGSTEYATHQYNGSCYNQNALDGVYRYTATDSLFVRASMVASWFDCMQVRKNNCATGASLLCDDGNAADSSWFDFWVEPGSTYYFIVDGYFNYNSGPYTFTLLSLSCPAPDSLVIATSDDDVVLRWTHVECDTPLYSIYRNDSLDVQAIPANLIGTTTDSTFTDVGILLTPDITNFYVVTAE